jgi:hypothetical protein
MGFAALLLLRLVLWQSCWDSLLLVSSFSFSFSFSNVRVQGREGREKKERKKERKENPAVFL